MKKALLIFILLVVSGFSGYILVSYYSYIFSKNIDGKLEGVERVTSPTALLGNVPSSQVFSFAIAIRTPDGEIYTASSEDRQWSIAKQGMCAKVKFYPYPPWDFEKGGTYFNARLIKLHDCPMQ